MSDTRNISTNLLNISLSEDQQMKLGPDEVRKIRLVNYLGVISIFNMLIYALFYSIADFRLFGHAILFLGLSMLLTLGIIVINKLGKHLLAKILLSGLTPLVMSYIATVAFGKAPGFQVYLFVSAIIPLFLWSYKQRIYPILFVCLSLLLYVLIEFAPPVFEPRIELNEGYIRFFRLTNLFVCFAAAGVAIGFYQLLFRKKEEQLLRQTEELRISQAHKDMVYSIIAHDIRTPFSNFAVLAEHLITQYNQSTDQERLEIIRAIHRSSASLHNLLENLLEWSRLQSGTLKVSCQDLDLRKVAEDSISLHNELIQEKEHHVQLNIQSGISVYADPQMTSAIFRNLISNAIKFTPARGEISVSATEANSMVEVLVEDNGYGIPHEHIDSLFVIRTGRSSGDPAATNPSGLGLLLCKDFVTTMGGEIRVESQLDQGSRFLFTIPRSINGADR